MGVRTKGPARPGAGEETPTRNQGPAGDAGRVDDAPRAPAAAEPPPKSAAPSQCYVQGRPVTGFWALLNRPAHLITTDFTHEFTKVYFQVPRDSKDGVAKFNLASDFNDRLGTQRIQRADYDPSHGLSIELSEYQIFVPTSDLKVCWKRPQ